MRNEIAVSTTGATATSSTGISGIGATVISVSVIGATVMEAGVTGARVVGAGAIGVTGARVIGAGATSATVIGAGATSARVIGAGATSASGSGRCRQQVRLPPPVQCAQPAQGQRPGSPPTVSQEPRARYPATPPQPGRPVFRAPVQSRGLQRRPGAP
jgi:hypothetical protein